MAAKEAWICWGIALSAVFTNALLVGYGLDFCKTAFEIGCFGSVGAGFALTRFGFYPSLEAWLARCPIGGCPLNRVSGLLMAFF